MERGGEGREGEGRGGGKGRGGKGRGGKGRGGEGIGGEGRKGRGGRGWRREEVPMIVNPVILIQFNSIKQTCQPLSSITNDTSIPVIP